MNKHLVSFFLVFSIVLLAVAGGGCSHYSFGASKPASLSKVGSIHVETFQNNSYYPRAEVLLTSSIVEELTSKGGYKSEPSGTADATLRGSIRSISLDQIRAQPYNTYRSLQTVMRVEVLYEVVQGTNGKVLKKGSVQVNSNYFNQNNQQAAKSDALSYAAREAAHKIVSELMY